MPKSWIYIFALVLPLLFRVLLMYTPMVEWFWYNGYPNLYNALALLKANQTFLTFLGGWAFPIFVVTMIGYWLMENDDETITSQFLLTPIAYVPFSIAVTMIGNMRVDFPLFYIHPLVIIPVGYVYVMLWMFIIWILEKAKLVA
jgi:purine-cytosine permease-like protein